jgi:hypothetical protein
MPEFSSLKSERVLVDVFKVANEIIALRADVCDAGIEWALAERELTTARATFVANCPDAIRMLLPDDIDDPALSRMAGRYLDASKREYDAMERWKRAIRAFVEALERKAQ